MKLLKLKQTGRFFDLDDIRMESSNIIVFHDEDNTIELFSIYRGCQIPASYHPEKKMRAGLTKHRGRVKKLRQKLLDNTVDQNMVILSHLPEDCDFARNYPELYEEAKVAYKEKFKV